MSMKKVIWVLLIVILSYDSFAQFDFSLFSSSSQQFIENCSASGFLIVSQSFQIKDKNGKKFGLNGNKHFGKTYSLGVKTNGGIYVSDKVLMPWNYDENFSNYEDDYTPVLYKTFIKELKDSVFVETEFVKTEKNYVFLKEEISGFASRKPKESTENWLVWVSGKKDLDSLTKFDDLQFIIYKREADFSKETEIEPPVTDGKLFGGIVLTADFSRVGQIQFLLNGLVFESGRNWKISPIEENEKAKNIEKKSSQNGGVLTPVEDEDSQKQNSRNKKRK